MTPHQTHPLRQRPNTPSHNCLRHRLLPLLLLRLLPHRVRTLLRSRLRLLGLPFRPHPHPHRVTPGESRRALLFATVGSCHGV